MSQDRKLDTNSIVSAFAGSLDEENFAQAGKLLNAECVYQQSAKTLVGREATLKSFRDSSQWARSNLDIVVYIHEIERCSDCSAAIRFIDLIEHAGKELRHECLMHVTVADDGLISTLRLEDLPGEMERVSAFLESVGIKR